MKLCERCHVPITGKVIVVCKSDGEDIVCEPCWIGFLEMMERIGNEEV